MTELRPGCKINLGLKITGRRKDGYHFLSSLFVPLSFPADTLVLEKTNGFEFILECDTDFCSENILHKTYRLFCEKADCRPGVKAILKKRIPAGAGLGGGSSDAASFLKWLNREAGSPLAEKELNEVGSAIGADVPFFILNKPAFVRGIGEIITPVTCFPRLNIVTVFPGIHIDTAWAFRTYDEEFAPPALTEKNLTNPAAMDTEFLPGQHGIPLPANDLEKTVLKHFPQLGELKRLLLEYGAFEAGMSGSGSSMYGIYDTSKKAAAAAARLRKCFKYVYFAKT